MLRKAPSLLRLPSRGSPTLFKGATGSLRLKSTTNGAGGGREMWTFTNSFDLPKSLDYTPMAAYRVMDEQGKIIATKEDPKLDKDTIMKMYQTMVSVNAMDSILYDVQRQGRISFYMQNDGEEATQVGCAAALAPNDTAFLQYREVGFLLWRGYSFKDCANQCASNRFDPGKGRQMPVHYGSRTYRVQTVSSPLATQIPQAAGSAYAQKLFKKYGIKDLSEEHGECTVCYFGEGAASEGDFHAAVNFAATLETPTIFFCRNNGYAISTPAKDQYRGDGIAGRGPRGYGVATVRIDGNDIFAVYNAVKAARQYAVTHNKPVLIEAMTYRIGHHSTSDDWTRYRKAEEVEPWKKEHHPIPRLNKFVQAKGWWTQEEDDALRKDVRKQVIAALEDAEKEVKPPLSDLFTDVYDTLPPHLKEQQQQLLQHLEQYAHVYPLQGFEKSHSN